MAEMQRIKFLDGLRGSAILLVVFYHAYARYPDVVPYLTNTYREFPLFKYGYWGVQLFFLISGFVILMSIVDKVFHEKSAGNIALNEMANYARSGDIIFVYSYKKLFLPV